jgi:hypothetical protein
MSSRSSLDNIRRIVLTCELSVHVEHRQESNGPTNESLESIVFMHRQRRTRPSTRNHRFVRLSSIDSLSTIISRSINQQARQQCVMSSQIVNRRRTDRLVERSSRVFHRSNRSSSNNENEHKSIYKQVLRGGDIPSVGLQKFVGNARSKHMGFVISHSNNAN